MRNLTTVFLLVVLMIGALTACMGSNEYAADTGTANVGQEQMPEPSAAENGLPSEPDISGNLSDAPQEPERKHKILVAYFSQTGNTAPLAKYVADITGADLYEIVPEVPYTDDDIAYQVSGCRANLEQNDDTCRPAISGVVSGMQDYDVVFLAFPIWWGEEPRIIDTFMDTYDFSGKTIIPFCTSGGSGIGTAESNLHATTDEAVLWISGSRFVAGTSKETLEEWVNSLGVLR